MKLNLKHYSGAFKKTYWWIKASLLVVFISALAYGYGTFKPNPIAVKEATEEVRIEHAELGGDTALAPCGTANDEFTNGVFDIQFSVTLDQDYQNSYDFLSSSLLASASLTIFSISSSLNPPEA